MRIGIDGRCLQKGKNTGVEEYARGLILSLIKNNPEKHFIIFVNAFGEIKENFDWLREFKNFEIKRFSVSNKILNFCFWFFSWPKIDKLLGGVEYFVLPNFNFGTVSSFCRQILTVHDLSFERMPETFSFKRRLWHFLINPRKKSREAYKIWAVSNSTKQDLVNIYGLNSEKIVVNSPFFNFDNFQKDSKKALELVRWKYKLPMKFFLFLGTIEPRKNIKGLIEGFEFFKERNSNWALEYKLIIAGEKGWLWEDVIERARTSEFSKDIIFTDFIEEKDKKSVYKLAQIFIYPSFYEGFGFPPLEAMACGIPTIASNCSSLPEILGDNVLLIDPYKSSEICLGMEILLNNKDVYDVYVKKGLVQSQKISRKERNFNLNF